MCGNKVRSQKSEVRSWKIEAGSWKIEAGSWRLLVSGFWLLASGFCFSQDIKQPNAAGTFYPDEPAELSTMIDSFLSKANPAAVNGEIFALICPHAGYGFSGETAGFGYKLIKDKPYKTVIIIGSSHYYGFNGVSVYPQGIFRTPLGDLEVDAAFAAMLFNNIVFDYRAFEKEHSVEVHLPFLQRVLPEGFKIVPIVMGDCTLDTCRKLAGVLKGAIGQRKDVLVIASTDMYHGYDYQEAERIDNLTMEYLKKMDIEGLYYGLRENRLQLCGGFAVVTALILSNELGHEKLEVLNQTNSAVVTGRLTKGIWTVGYSSCVIDKQGEEGMLNQSQKKRLFETARSSIETYLNTGKKIEVSETDAVLLKEMGAFVTLRQNGELRGCIGNIIGDKPLYLTVRDMAVEAAVNDWRFPAVGLEDLKNIEIEISVLSPLERIASVDDIRLGKHGVLIRRGLRSGVFLPQVADETGWSKEEFLSNLCSHKAGLSPDAWKDKDTEIYIFSAEVFFEE